MNQNKPKICLYGKLNQILIPIEYGDGISDTAETSIDNVNKIIYVDVTKTPGSLITPTGVTFNGSEDINIDLSSLLLPPTEDGDYVLSCSVVEGKPSYSWIKKD